MSHEYAQLQKQLLAANEEVALSASLVQQLTTDAGSALSRTQTLLPEQDLQPVCDGGAGRVALSRSWDLGKPAVKVWLAPRT